MGLKEAAEKLAVDRRATAIVALLVLAESRLAAKSAIIGKYVIRGKKGDKHKQPSSPFMSERDSVG